MNKHRLDQALVQSGLIPTRSQAESYIKLGLVTVNKNIITKPGSPVTQNDDIRLTAAEQYVSRAGLKLASVTQVLGLDFNNKVVLDVGSSTGGFTDYALRHGATKVIAVDVGTNQLHPTLQGHPQIELYEKTDIRNLQIRDKPDIVVVDVSFISLRDVLPSIFRLCSKLTQVAVMVKPQFEASNSGVKHKGVVKNDTMRRQILKDFEHWIQQYAVIIDKADSTVSGSKGNQERFYLLK